MQRNVRAAPYDMSLRLWSEETSVKPIVRDLGVGIRRLYERGDTMVLANGRPGPIAPRHYASVAEGRTTDEAEIPAWLDDTLGRLDRHPTLPDLMRSGQVEALLWIATLGGDPVPPPLRVDPAHVATATRLGARIFLEDYNRFDAGGVPLKTWLN